MMQGEQLNNYDLTKVLRNMLFNFPFSTGCGVKIVQLVHFTIHLFNTTNFKLRKSNFTYVHNFHIVKVSCHTRVKISHFGSPKSSIILESV